MKLTDEQIAAAMELRFGCGYSWKKIARMADLDYQKMYMQIYRAMHRGMR